MHAETPTKLPLARWFRIMGVHPLHAAGVQLVGTSGTPNIQQRYCSQAWAQHDWQTSDRVGREELANAISEAESQLEEYLRFRLLPAWEYDERYVDPGIMVPEGIWRGTLNYRGYNPTVLTNYAHFLYGGVRAYSPLAAGTAITYTDPDNDNYDELATVTVAVTTTDEEEIRVYYPGHGGEDAWEIRPVNVVIAAGVATITFRREQAVDPDVDESYDWEVVDGADNALFLTTVDVGRLYNDPQTQVSFLWEPASNCGCGGATCPSCSYTTQTGCLIARHAEYGMVAYQAAEWDAATGTFQSSYWTNGRRPDQARLFYRSGWRNMSMDRPTIEMDPRWERAVSYFAASKLDRPTCQCSEAGVTKWQVDRAFRGGATELQTFELDARDLDNPFGTTAGAIYAWHRVRDPNVAVAKAVSL